MKKYFPLLIIASLAMLQPRESVAQKDSPHDTAYYDTYPGSITARVYYNLRYTGLNFPSSNETDFQYRPNAKRGLGLGATYHNFSLNIAFGVGFLNTNNDKGKTKGFGLQIHAYPHKWAADIVTAFNKGCYIDPKGYAAINSNSYYYRPDVKFNLAGLAAYRVPNAAKFSYRAAMTQNEWQKKSAGSLLFGGQAYYMKLKGDSNLVPVKVEGPFPQADAKDIHTFGIGPGIGYAYTLVASKHIFFMGSVIANFNINFSTESGDNGSDNKTSVEPSAVFKGAIGYNSSSWDVSANVAGFHTLFMSPSVEKNYYIPAGIFRIVLARKFMPKHKK